MLDLDEQDKSLLVRLKDFLTKHYALKRHHVAAVMRGSGGKEYFALHIDIQGFDVCAEPIALHNTLLDGEQVELVMAVIMTNNGPQVVNPCGNCRQMLLQYCPQASVVIHTEKGLKKSTAIELLPNPY